MIVFINNIYCYTQTCFKYHCAFILMLEQLLDGKTQVIGAHFPAQSFSGTLVFLQCAAQV